MPRGTFDELHNHATWGPTLRPEHAEEGRLHRHRIMDKYATPRFTSWQHNGANHAHRLPDGAWTRPRVDLRPPLDDRARESGRRLPGQRGLGERAREQSTSAGGMPDTALAPPVDIDPPGEQPPTE